MAEIVSAKRTGVATRPRRPERGAVLRASRSMAWLRALAIAGWTVWLTTTNLRGIFSKQGLPASVTMRWHRNVLRFAGIEVSVTGEPILDRPVLMLANHTSYIDIVVLGSILPCSFVAKEEVASWPVFSWLARKQRAIFVKRHARRAADQLDEMKRRLREGGCLILFPEGTSSDGLRVLPFKSSLLQAAEINLPDSGEIDVQTISISYTRLDGMPMGRALRPYFTWYGDMELAPHLIEWLGLGTLGADIVFHKPTKLSDAGDRKRLAKLAQATCAAGVESSLNGRAAAVDPYATDLAFS